MIRPALPALTSLAVAAASLLSPAARAGCGICEVDTAHAHPEGLAPAIAAAHGGEAYRARDAVAADFELDFPGMFAMSGKIVFDTPAGRSQITTDDGVVITFDGETCSVSPADAPLPPGMARFHALTWPYFVAAPFKLGDPGAHLTDAGPLPWDDGNARPALELTFGDGVGDAPDDWYKVFADEKHRLRGMAYIVSYGKGVTEAEKSPGAIVYRGYADVEGALLSTEWSFHPWSDDRGLGEKQKGTGKLTNVHFIAIDDDTFAHPDDMRVDAKP